MRGAGSGFEVPHDAGNEAFGIASVHRNLLHRGGVEGRSPGRSTAFPKARRGITVEKLRSLRWWLRQALVTLFEREIVPNPEFDPTVRIYLSDPRDPAVQIVQEDLAKDVSYLAAYVNVRRLIRYLPLLIAWGLAVERNKPAIIYENPGEEMEIVRT